MNEDHVSHSLAVALKAAGFDWHCRAAWHYDGSEWNFIKDYASTFQHPKEIPDWKSASWDTPYIVSAPTLAMAQKWLREGARLHVGACPALPTLKWQFYIDDLGQHVNPHDGELITRWTDEMLVNTCDLFFDSYEAALSAGIEAVLKLIDPNEAV